MKLTGILLLALTVQVSAGSLAQNVSISMENGSLKEVFKELRKQTGYYFIYNDEVIKEAKPVTIHIVDRSINDALSEIFKKQPFNYSLQGNIIIVKRKEILIKEFSLIELSSLEINAPPLDVQGKVTDGKGEILIGVTIRVKGSSLSVTSDIQGNFSIQVPEENSTLIFSSIGYKTQEVIVNNRSTLKITLVEDVKALEQIVVVGYGKQKKTTVTGAVSSMGTKELVQSPQANVSNMLVGRLPGLLAVQRSGQPGEDQSTLRIRGIGTFSGSQDPLIMVDGVEGINLNNIDPNEIETISILKDASATAVYGVRGANGVILVTTKRGTLGRPQVSVSTNYASTSFIDMRESARAYSFVQGYNEALKYDSYISKGYTPKYDDEEVDKFKTGEDPIFYPDVDWFNTMYRKRAGQSQHNLNVTGGTDRVKYFVSAGYFNQEGLFNKNITRYIDEYDLQPTFHRYNFRSNLDFSILKGLTANMNISYQFEERAGAFHDLNARLSAITRANPINSPGIVDGHPITLGATGAGSGALSSLFSSGYQRRHRNYLNALARLNYDLSFITKGLSTHGVISYSNYNTQDGGFYKPVVMYNPIRNPDGTILYVPQSEEGRISYSESVDKNRREYFEFGITYNQKFNAHNVGGLLLYNQNKYHDPNLAFLVPRGHQGLVGRLTYDYQGRYMAEVNMGYNGTENFIEGKRFGFFPAYSLGWNVSEESFYPKNDIISFFKIRGSMGEVGNDQIGGDRFLYLPSSYNYVNEGYSFGETGSTLQQYISSNEGKIGNPNLTWERARKTNIGIEAKLWNNSISLNADYFVEKRNNILANLGTVPMVVGATLPAANFGRMRNGGFDGDITFQNNISGFAYWIKANFTYARNKVEYKDEVDKPYDYLYGTGQRHGQNFGLIFDGFYNTWEEVNYSARPQYLWSNNRVQPGDVRYKDVNADGIIDADDFVPIGYSNFPEKVGGVSFGGDYKDFDFSVLFQWADNVSVSYSGNFRYGYREEAGIPQYILDQSWTHERYNNGEDIQFPHLSEGDVTNKHNYQPSSLWVRDASYMRLKNAEIGYTLKGQNLARIGLSSVRFYANGNNLITWSKLLKGVDPESNLVGTNNEPYPLTRTINFGLNVKL